MEAASVARPPNWQAGLLEERLELLRRVDSYVDLSRGWLQLRLLVELGRRGGEASVAELASALGVERKAVLDSLRKMRQKNLVANGKRGPMLTDRGLEVYRSLVQAVAGGRGGTEAHARGRSRTVDLYSLIASLTRHHYLYEVLTALAYAPNHMLPLTSLASLARLSPRQLDEYLQVYTRGTPRLLQRLVKEQGRGPLRGQVVYYRLTREGEKLVHRLPEYSWPRRSRAARLLTTLTRSLHPRIVLKRLTMLVSLASTLALTAAALEPGLATPLLGAWLLVVALLTALVEQSY